MDPASKVTSISPRAAADPSSADTPRATAAVASSDRRQPGVGARAASPEEGGSASDRDLRGPGAGQSGGEEPRHTLNELLDQLQERTDLTAPDILQGIGRRFTEARKLNKPEAWRQLQADLMHNSHLLCPAIMGYKDLITTVREIEDFMKGSVGTVGKSNEELLADFLRGEGPMAAETLAAGKQAPTQVAEPAIMPAETSISDAPDDSHREA